MQHTPKKTQSPDSNPFAQLCSELDRWRQTRRLGERIPETLWNAATALARTHGVSATSNALKLNYSVLQRRLGASPRTRTRPSQVAPPTFVPLPSPPKSSMLDPDTLEILHPYGARLTYRMPRAKARDLLLWMTAFLRS